MIAAPATPWLDMLFATYLELRELLPVGPWSKENVVLSKEISPANPGPYDPEVAPLSSVLFDWFLDPQWREFIGVKSSQAGFTQAALVLICYIIEHQLGHVMFTMDSAGRAKDLNNERLKPMITEGCKCLGRYVPPSEDALQNMVLLLKGLKVFLAGAKSAGQIASRTIPYIFGDEVDEWEEELRGGESNTLDLLRDRMKLIDHAKLAVFSKPRNAPAEDEEKAEKAKKKKKDQGIIWGEYLTGSRHKCFVPCPHCDHFQELVWEQVRFGHCRNADGKSWDYLRMLQETYYECINSQCRGHIHEHHKREMLRRREWRQTNHGQDKYKPIPRKFSCHASDLYSLFAGSSFGDLAVEYVSARSTSQRRKFRRSRLGLPVEEKVIAQARLTTILKLQGQYLRGQVPKKPALLALFADVQLTKVKWVKLAWLLDGTCYVVDFGTVEDENELIGEMDKPVKVLDWGDTPAHRRVDPYCRVGLIDEGDGKSTRRILDFCVSRKAYGRVFPCKGRGGRQTEHMKDRVTVQKNRVHKNLPLARYLIDHEYFLDEIYGDRIGRFDEISTAEAAGETPPVPRLWLFSQPDTELCQELCAETKDWHIENGQLVFGWLPKPPSGLHNDFSDCIKEGMGMWYVMRPLLLKKLSESKSAEPQVDKVDDAAPAA